MADILYIIGKAFASWGCLLCFLFVGCEPKTEDKSHASDESSNVSPKSRDEAKKQGKDDAKPEQNAIKKRKNKKLAVVDMIAPTSIVVRVNGEAITKGEFIIWERARTKAWAMAKGWKPDTVNAETRKYRLQNRARALAELLKHKLIGQYAQTEGIAPDKKELAAQKRRFLRLVKKPKSTFEDVIAIFGEAEGAALRRIVQGDALTMAVLEHSTSNNLRHVSAEEFTNRVEFVKKWNARADETNAAVRVRAAKAKAEILGGAYFADVAKKYADFLPEQGEKWDTFYLDDFEGDDPLGQWLARSETGDISDPLDLDDGISIVGLKMKYESSLSESNKPPVYAYDVVRCPFYAYEKLDDFDGDEKSIIDDIIEKRRQLAMNELRDRLIKKAKIEFPSGDNLFYPPDKKKKKSVKGKAKAAGKTKATVKPPPTGKPISRKNKN